MKIKLKQLISGYTKKKIKRKNNYSWIIKITLVATIVSFFFSYISEVFVSKLNIYLSIGLLLIIILLGVIFDIIGVAITTVNIAPFHSMNSKKIKSAKYAIKLINNSEKVASFCNDVIGDICGILSGTFGVLISTSLALKFNINLTVTTLILASVIAGLTIGGKALGKNYAINENVYIIYKFSQFISIFKIKSE